jgi:hypothetical protein
MPNVNAVLGKNQKATVTQKLGGILSPNTISSTLFSAFARITSADLKPKRDRTVFT